MAVDKIRESFLLHQFEEGMALARESDILELAPVSGDPPDRYIIGLKATGLVQGPHGVEEFDGCEVGFWMPEDYLRRVDLRHVLTYLGPHPRPWHPNIRPPYICLGLRPGTPLVDVVTTLYELWTWNLYDTSDEGLQHAVAQWARHQDPSRFPVDRRSSGLRRRSLNLQVEPVEQEA